MGDPIQKELEEIREESQKENIKVSNKDLKIIYILIIIAILFFLGFLK